jgi:uncharacterized protein (TIRG00374 family)
MVRLEFAISSFSAYKRPEMPSLMSRAKKFVGPAKWIFAALLLYFTIRSGKLDFGQLKIFLSNPIVGVLCLSITLVWYSLCFFRWKLLLKSQSVEITFKKAFHLGMLGQFFQTFMPGTMGADLSKALYIGRRYPNQKLRAMFSVLVDRVIGLYAILVLGALAFVAGWKHLKELKHPLIPLIQSLGYMLWAILAVGVVGLLLFPGLQRTANRFRHMGRKLPQILQKPIRYVEKAVSQYGERPGALWVAILISLCTHGMAVGMLYLIANVMFGPAPWGALDLSGFMLASSLGLVAMALPIAPHGLGVGQVAFASVFMALGVGNISFGGSIVTAFQLVTLVANLLGFVFFVTHKNEISEMESLESSPQES